MLENEKMITWFVVTMVLQDATCVDRVIQPRLCSFSLAAKSDSEIATELKSACVDCLLLLLVSLSEDGTCSNNVMSIGILKLRAYVQIRSGIFQKNGLMHSHC